MLFEKRCFLISQIGKPETKERKHADYIYELVKKLVEKSGYELNRADSISASGSISHYIIDSIFAADLVIADLSARNPNVFYELALRHATNKPFIQIIEESEINLLPFDVHDQRTLTYLYTQNKKNDDERNKLFEIKFAEYVRNCEFSPQEIKNPIVAENTSIVFLKNEEKPIESVVIDIISLLLEKLSSSIPNAEFPYKFTKDSYVAFKKANVDILENIKQTLEKSKKGVISCSGPLIVTTFKNFMKYIQSSFVAVSVNDLEFWTLEEGQEYLEITVDHLKKNQAVNLERIFVISKKHKPNEAHFEKIFLHQLRNKYKIGIVLDEALKSITDNILKLDFGLFDKYAVSFFRFENGRFFEINTTKDICRQYNDYYEQIKRKCIKFDDSDNLLVSDETQLQCLKEALKLRNLFEE